jgi:dihydroorotate dehydrogenase electron transfer subunit
MEFMLPKQTFITKIEQDNYRTRTFELTATLDGYPGQFAMVWLPRFDEKPFSLVNTDPVTLMITAVGPFSRLVHELQVGDRLWLRGPLGHGFQVAPTEQRLVLVGGGYGVAPLYWLARTQIDRVETIDVVIGARTAVDVLYAERFQQLAAAPGHRATLRIHITTEDGSAGAPGLVTTALEPLLNAAPVDGIYGCGPHGMLAALQRIGQRHAIPCQLSWEAYMRCGIGICGSCEHEGQVLCLDGPVLPT